MKTYTIGKLFSAMVVRIDVHDLYDSTMLKYLLEDLKVTYIFVKQTVDLFSFFTCWDDGAFPLTEFKPLTEFRQLLDDLKIPYDIEAVYYEANLDRDEVQR